MASSRDITKSRGRPPTGKGVGVLVRLQPDLLAALDAWVEKYPKPLSRPAAIRAILAAGLSVMDGDDDWRPWWRDCRAAHRSAAEDQRYGLDAGDGCRSTVCTWCARRLGPGEGALGSNRLRAAEARTCIPVLHGPNEHLTTGRSWKRLEKVHYAWPAPSCAKSLVVSIITSIRSHPWCTLRICGIEAITSLARPFGDFLCQNLRRFGECPWATTRRT